jgi:hypothetical protein
MRQGAGEEGEPADGEASGVRRRARGSRDELRFWIWERTFGFRWKGRVGDICFGKLVRGQKKWAGAHPFFGRCQILNFQMVFE